MIFDDLFACLLTHCGPVPYFIRYADAKVHISRSSSKYAYAPRRYEKRVILSAIPKVSKSVTGTFTHPWVGSVYTVNVFILEVFRQ